MGGLDTSSCVSVDAALRALGDGVLLFDCDGRITYANATASQLLGHGAPDLRGRPGHGLIEQLREDGDGQHSECAVLDVATDGRTRRGSARLRRSDGALIPIGWSCAPVHADGRIVGLAMTFREQPDATAERAADLGAEDVFRYLADAGNVLASSLDPRTTLENLAGLLVPRMCDLCIVDALRARGVERSVFAAPGTATPAEVEALRGSPPDTCADGGVATVLERGVPLLVPEVTDEALRETAGSEERYRRLRGIGIRSGLTVPLVARGEVVGALTLLSTTSGRRYEERDLRIVERLAVSAALALDNALLYDEAVLSTKLRDEMLAIVSHDLRSPLMMIGIGLGAVRRRLAGEDAHLIDHLREAVERAGQLIQDLLDVTRVEAGALPLHPTRTRLRQVLHKAVELHRPLAMLQGVSLHFCADGDDPELQVDWHRVRQVVDNLVSNAIRHASEPGRVTVWMLEELDGVRVVIEDDGPGVPLDERARIFDRFRQLGRWRRAGAGLGLAIAKGIVEAHGGQIGLESPLEGGARFWFTLPRASAT